MNILIQIPQLIFGGAEKVLVSFANDLVSRGHQVEVLETYEKGLLKDQFDPRVTFHAICSKEYTQKYYMSLAQIKATKGLDKLAGCGKLAFSKVVGYRRFAEKLAAKHYESRSFDVAINYLEIDSPEFLLTHIHAKRYLQWYHTDIGNLEHPEETDALIPWFSKMDHIICVAESARKNFVSRYPQLKNKTAVLYNYFDTDTILAKGTEPFSFAGPSPIVLSVGRMTEPKKYLRFLDVLARLKSEGFTFGWHVLGAGIQESEIREKIANSGLDDCVFLDGLTDNPYKYMKNCDLFVLPSGWEGFPTVTIEAKTLGCPVLATDVSGIREQLRHGETGWIVDNNADAIYCGLKFLLTHPETITKLKDNSRMEHILSNDEKHQQFLSLCH